MKHLIPFFYLFLSFSSFSLKEKPLKMILARDVLEDRIKGGWAGQVMGLGFAFSMKSCEVDSSFNFIDSLALEAGILQKLVSENLEQFYDVSFDLRFLEILQNEDFDLTQEALGAAFVNANFPGGHAYQTARFNILDGKLPPFSGHWIYNPHADDMAFQKHADFIGLMNPGMPAAAAQWADKFGHITNYGDGYYAGLFIANIYSIAFTKGDISQIIEDALSNIPQQTDFASCLRIVQQAYRNDTTNWIGAGDLLKAQWPENLGCPDGVYSDFSNDAKRNAAYVMISLLFGNGDLNKSLRIAHCLSTGVTSNLSTVGGILGALHGYKKLPQQWQKDLMQIENIEWPHSTITLSNAYAISLAHALHQIRQHGGRVHGHDIAIVGQTPQLVKFERSFEGHYPSEKRLIKNGHLDSAFRFEFEGIGFLIKGDREFPDDSVDYTFEADVFLNEKIAARLFLPFDGSCRKADLFWQYQLPHEPYRVDIVPLNPDPAYPVMITELILYDVRNK